MLKKLGRMFDRLRGGAVEVSLHSYDRLVKRMDRLSDDFRRDTDGRLRTYAESLAAQFAAAGPHGRINDLLVNGFALVREVADRTLGLRPYHEQLLAGIVLHQGKVAQMQTGEGKTLAAVAPAIVNAWLGSRVHLLTYNDYLASRDADWMGPIFEFLGLSVGCVTQGMATAERKQAYRCDVTYVTAKEAGFDFLRDQLVRDINDTVHRGQDFAIIDEVDSILVDEARVPLVIAGDTAEEAIDTTVLASIVRELQANVHFSTDDRGRNVNFTAAGLDHLEAELDCGDLHDEERLPILTRLNQALHAEHLLQRDIDYIVRDGHVLLLDELTGRIAQDRRWPYGLQEALEAKESQPIQPPGKILGSITLQHFVALYDKLAGMTGTAEEAADELQAFYGMSTAVIDTHHPCIRADANDEIYVTRQAKIAGIIQRIQDLRKSGQPVLVGTASVQESDQLVDALRAVEVPCQVLNAKNDFEEAAIIAEAGTYGSVTISTNMAGRGTDIKLGGTDEQDRTRIFELGGLHVVGTNRHESRRIDNQLRGRSGRQGDPGSTGFIFSLEDDLLRRFGITEALAGYELDDTSSAPLHDALISSKVEHVQRVIEGECFEIRKTLRKYAQIIENQRQTIAARRLRLLSGQYDPFEDLVLHDLAAERYREVLPQVGEEVLHEVERVITIVHIDRCWADHLERIAEVRESIHLYSLGGLDPYFEYQKQASKAFHDLREQINRDVVRSFERAAVTNGGLDLAEEDLLGPSSTWTYMINDHPVGDVFDRLARSLKKMLTRTPA